MINLGIVNGNTFSFVLNEQSKMRGFLDGLAATDSVLRVFLWGKKTPFCLLKRMNVIIKLKESFFNECVFMGVGRRTQRMAAYDYPMGKNMIESHSFWLVCCCIAEAYKWSFSGSATALGRF